MILVDVNILVYAFREGAEHHRSYADWLSVALAGAEELLLPDMVLSGFLRIVTNSRLMEPPAAMADAMDFVGRLRRSARSVDSSAVVWDQFEQLVAADPHIKANLVPDCYLAAVALTHRARVASRDRGFGRFAGLRYFDPVQR